MPDILYRLRRQVVPRPRAGRRGLPALHRLVDRLDSGLCALAARQIVDFLAVQHVADANLDLVEAVEHVELGQGDAGDPVDRHRLAHQHGIEPAAAALAPRHGAELVPLLAEELANLVVLLRRERSLADAGRIGLGDAEYIADTARPHAGACRRLSGGRVRRGHKGIGAVVDVQQCALRALEQDARAALAVLVEDFPNPVDIGNDRVRNRAQLLHQRLVRDFVIAEATAKRVVMGQQPVDFRRQRFHVLQVHRPDRATADLVLIGGADAAPRRTDLGVRVRRCVLADAIQLAMDRQDQRRVLGDAQPVGADRHALVGEVLVEATPISVPA